MQCWNHTGLPELNPVRPLILHHPHMVDGVVGGEGGSGGGGGGGGGGDESSMSWLYDFYPNVLESVQSSLLIVSPRDSCFR